MDSKAKRTTPLLAEVNANVEAWYAGQIDYEAFGARQRAIWDRIHAAGRATTEQVLRALRKRLPPPPPHMPREGVMDAAICTHTQKRRDACHCGACIGGQSPAMKRRANQRDALALLDLIAGCIENHPREQVARVTWGHVGDAAHVRERLMEIAVGFALGPEGDERVARLRIEEALCADDEHLGEALIEAM
jgi:hypothetical protein